LSYHDSIRKMNDKWKTPIRCTGCDSTAVRRREVVHKSGTAFFSGRGSSSGFSFGLTSRSRPRIWFGGGSHTGKRQSITAREAQPPSFWPAIVMAGLIFIFRGENESFGFWSWFGFFFSGLWLLAAIFAFSRYQEEWLCSKCGARFIPEPAQPEQLNNIKKNELPGMAGVSQKNVTILNNGKACSICGERYPSTEFEYGNREGRSYCKQCNKEERAAYSLGGADAARKYREDMRSRSKKSGPTT
jgi:hypothetical protein